MSFASDAAHTNTSYAFDISALGRRPLRPTITPLDPGGRRRRDGTPRSVPIVKIASARLAPPVTPRPRRFTGPVQTAHPSVSRDRSTGPIEPPKLPTPLRSVPGRVPTAEDSELLRAAVLFRKET